MVLNAFNSSNLEQLVSKGLMLKQAIVRVASERASSSSQSYWMIVLRTQDTHYCPVCVICYINHKFSTLHCECVVCCLQSCRRSRLIFSSSTDIRLQVRRCFIGWVLAVDVHCEAIVHCVSKMFPPLNSL